MRNGIQIGDKVNGELLYGVRGIGRVGTVTHIEEKDEDARFDIIRLSVKDERIILGYEDTAAEQTGLFYRKDIRTWEPRTVTAEELVAPSEDEANIQDHKDGGHAPGAYPAECELCVEHLSNIPDTIRADHMAEKHVGEPQARCDLCANEALPPLTDVTNAAGETYPRPR